MPEQSATGKRRRWPWGRFYELSFANKILVTTLVLLIVLGVAGTAIFWGMLKSRLSEEFAGTSRMLAKGAAARAGPIPGTSSNGVAPIALARFARWAPMAQRWASSRRRWTKYRTGSL